jgi:multidrug resistance efflux pump
MLGASNIRLVALANGIAFPVSDLASNRLSLAGFPAGTNPFQPFNVGDLIPMTLVAERSGHREVMMVEAQLDNLFAGEATFALPHGLGEPMPAPADLVLPPAGSPATVVAALGAPPAVTPAYAQQPAHEPAYAADYGQVVNPYDDGGNGVRFAHSHDSTDREELSRIDPAPEAPLPAGSYVAPPFVAGTPGSTALAPSTPGYAYGADMPPYAPGAPGVAPYVPQYGQGYAPVPTTGLATTPAMPVGQHVEELGEDDDRSDRFKRGAGLVVLGALALLAVLVLMLMQRSGVQSVQAAMRGQRVDVSAPSDGVLDRLNVSEGSMVRAGQPLFSMDNRLYQAEMEQLRFAAEEQTRLVEGLQQALETARRLVGSGTAVAAAAVPVTVGGSPAQTYTEPASPARIEAAQARLNAAQIRERETRESLARAQRLFDGGAMTRGDFEEARADAQAAEAEAAARAADLREAQTGRTRTTRGSSPRVVYRGGDTGSSRISAQLRVLDIERELVQAQARQRTAELQLQQAMSRASEGGNVTAKSNGIVSTVYRNSGASVRAGDPVISVETSENPYVIAYFPFREARLIRQGARADVEFPSTGTTAEGRVDAIGTGALADYTVRTSIRDDQQLTPVRIRLGQMPQGTAPGAQADVTVEVGLRTVLSGRLH